MTIPFQVYALTDDPLLVGLLGVCELIPLLVMASGAAARFMGIGGSIVSGGVLCVVGTLALAAALPTFLRYDGRDGLAKSGPPTRSGRPGRGRSAQVRPRPPPRPADRAEQAGSQAVVVNRRAALP